MKMPWVNDTFYYTKRNLKAIADRYEYLYTDAPTVALFSIAETKADFDMALSAIGKAYWNGLPNLDFRYYRHYGRLQQVIIADILGIPDRYLEGLGFYDIPKLRGMAYFRMVEHLNERKMVKAKEAENE